MKRIALAVPLIAALAACQVSNDGNGTTSVEYNQDLAENAAADVSNTAQDVGGIIVNDVSKTADKVGGAVQNTDVDVDVDTNTQANSQ